MTLSVSISGDDVRAVVTCLDDDVIDGVDQVDRSDGRRLTFGVGSVTLVGTFLFLSQWGDLKQDQQL